MLYFGFLNAAHFDWVKLSGIFLSWKVSRPMKEAQAFPEGIQISHFNPDHCLSEWKIESQEAISYCLQHAPSGCFYFPQGLFSIWVFGGALRISPWWRAIRVWLVRKTEDNYVWKGLLKLGRTKDQPFWFTWHRLSSIDYIQMIKMWS